MSENSRFDKGIPPLRGSASIAAFLLSPKGLPDAHPGNRAGGLGAVLWNGRPTRRACDARAEGLPDTPNRSTIDTRIA